MASAALPAPMASTTANWHWKNKNITGWGREWLERELTSITVSGAKEGEEVYIATVTEVQGDIELGQRKSKLITIFDCKVSVTWAGKTSDGAEVNGSLTIPEVSHEVICDRLSSFEYQWTLSTAASPEVDAIYDLAKSRLPVAIETKLATFPSAMVDTHGKDITISSNTSRTGTPAPTTNNAPSAALSNAQSTQQQQKQKKDPSKLNTTTVVVEAEFHASAEDLFSLLTDEKRIPAWTRAPAQSKPEVGAGYSIFGGGVKGEYISISPSKEIVQTWALQSPTWPSDHAAVLTTTLDQDSESTKVVFRLAGVPTGMEDEIKRNLDGYYIHGFKSIGYVYLCRPPPVYSSSYYDDGPSRAKRDGLSTSQYCTSAMVIAIAIIVFIAAFGIPYLSSPPPATKL